VNEPQTALREAGGKAERRDSCREPSESILSQAKEIEGNIQARRDLAHRQTNDPIEDRHAEVAIAG
jgi:hypothetical protein